MKNVLIVENSTNSLQRLVENKEAAKEFILGGVFTVFDEKNRNDRVYTADKFLPCLDELNERMKTMGVVYGEYDHPDVFDTSLSRSSHIIKKAGFVKEHNRVDGEIKLLTTYWGREARALINDGCPIFVSSRAAGVTESDGTVTLKKLFTYDIVADPGFASARMDVKNLNESFGYSDKANFRIYEVSNESKINELFNMNKNEMVTKKQLTDYSNYLVTEIASTKKAVTKALKSGGLDSKKLEQLLESYDELQKTNSQIVKYLDYLADKVQVAVNENSSLKSTTEKLIKHNDYLAENLEKSINYSEYLAENLDKNIEYSEYIAENLDKNISYSEYLAENLDKNISYSEYIAENLDKNISYSEYLAENLDKNISYSEYIAEHVDNSIAYAEYLAEHVEGNIAYSEYIAENLDDNIAYSEYVAESLDKSITYQGMIVERLNGGKVFEGMESQLPTLESIGFEQIESDDDAEEEEIEEVESEEGHNWGDEREEGLPAGDVDPELIESVDSTESTIETEVEAGDAVPTEVPENNIETEVEAFEGNSDTELSQSIDKLIEEAKKRKAAETTDLHFLKFLNKSQVDSFYSLTNEEQEAVKLYISEKSFFNTKDVLRLITEALSTKNETLEERALRLMPESVKPIWNQLNESSRKSILSQLRLYPEDVLQSESQIEHFWETRPLKKNESVTKKLVAHETLIQEDKISDAELTSMLERFKSL